MPGYLGTQADFRRGVELPLSKSRGAGAGARELEVAQAALAHLHSALLPFVMRRLKGDVLRQLPPKTVVDVLVPLAPAQRALYAAFLTLTRSTWLKDWSPAIGEEQPDAESEGAEGAGAAAQPSVHLFTALHLLRQVLGHPDLVPREALPGLQGVQGRSSSSSSGGGLRAGPAAFALEHSCKLLALRDIFCSWGSPAVRAGMLLLQRARARARARARVRMGARAVGGQRGSRASAGGLAPAPLPPLPPRHCRPRRSQPWCAGC